MNGQCLREIKFKPRYGLTKLGEKIIKDLTYELTANLVNSRAQLAIIALIFFYNSEIELYWFAFFYYDSIDRQIRIRQISYL